MSITLKAGDLWGNSSRMFLITELTGSFGTHVLEDKWRVIRLALGKSEKLEFVCQDLASFEDDTEKDIVRWLEEMQFNYIGNISTLTKALLCPPTTT